MEEWCKVGYKLKQRPTGPKEIPIRKRNKHCVSSGLNGSSRTRVDQADLAVQWIKRCRSSGSSGSRETRVDRADLTVQEWIERNERSIYKLNEMLKGKKIVDLTLMCILHLLIHFPFQTYMTKNYGTTFYIIINTAVGTTEIPSANFICWFSMATTFGKENFRTQVILVTNNSYSFRLTNSTLLSLIGDRYRNIRNE
ncbi:hypothetical protein YC2023_119037 [Brassica napus]